MRMASAALRKQALLVRVLQSPDKWPVPRGNALSADLEDLHESANAGRLPAYTDPATGYSVMPAWLLRERGVCCGNSCRHCPYGHLKVAPEFRTARITSAVVLRGVSPGPYAHVVCFAPSAAAVSAVQRRTEQGALAATLLVTPFDPLTYQCEPWSSWPLTAAMDAAAALGVSLLVVPAARAHSAPEMPPAAKADGLAAALWAALLDARSGVMFDARHSRAGGGPAALDPSVATAPTFSAAINESVDAAGRGDSGRGSSGFTSTDACSPENVVVRLQAAAERHWARPL